MVLTGSISILTLGVIHNSRIQLLARFRWRSILNLYALRCSDHNQVEIPRVSREIDTLATREEHIEAFKQGRFPIL